MCALRLIELNLRDKVLTPHATLYPCNIATATTWSYRPSEQTTAPNDALGVLCAA